MKQRRFIRKYWPFIIIIVVLIIARFSLLVITPASFYIDEVATGAHVRSMIENHTDYHGTSLPLMSSSFGGGFTTSVYLLPLTAWSSLFGYSELSLHMFSQFVTILAAIFIGLGVRQWLTKRAGLIATIVALALPWSWVGGNLAWDPAITPLYVALAWYVFCLLANKRYRDSPVRSVHAGLLSLLLVIVAYSYPPMRVGAPLLLLAALLYLWFNKLIKVRDVIVVGVVGALSATPLLLFMLEPTSLERSSTLSVFHDTNILEGIGAFLFNIIQILNPYTLFVTGDSNLRHATGFQGMLGWASLLALAYLIYHLYVRRRRLVRAEYHLLIIAVVGALCGIIGSALTNEGQPHYLRAVAAWPFLAVVIGLGWRYITKSKTLAAKYGLVALGIIFVVLFIIDLAIGYPERRHDFFQHTTDYPPMVKWIDYYYR